MAHVYCVDGTNVVRGTFGYGGPLFRDQEEADSERLVTALARTCQALGGKVEVDLFFDGGRRAINGAPAASNLRVRFADDVSADDLILDRVRAKRHSGGGSVTVVTADGELGRKVSAEGGKWLKVRPGTPLERIIGAIESRFFQ